MILKDALPGFFLFVIKPAQWGLVCNEASKKIHYKEIEKVEPVLDGENIIGMDVILKDETILNFVEA